MGWRFIRYIVHQRVEGDPRYVGLFTAAYNLRDEEELRPRDFGRLGDLLTWFQTELPVPPKREIPARAVFWFHDANRYVAPMWELAAFLREYDFVVELRASSSIGRVVYSDRYQVAAVPYRRGHRRR